MHKVITLVASVLVTVPVWAQPVMRSSSPSGVQIQGNTDITAKQDDTAAVAVGRGNEARNTAGAIAGSVTIQGNTNIKVQQKDAKALAIGKDNKATNEAGVIGDK